MRNMMLSAALALTALAVPGVAAAQSGYVDVWYGNTEVDAFGTDGDVDAIGVDAVGSFDLGGSLGSQFGGHYARLDGDGDEVDAFAVDGHLFTRNDNWQVGGGVGFSQLEAGGDDVDEWAVAAEGLYFLPQTTLGATLTYGESDVGVGDNLELVALDGEARFFVTDNFRVNVGAGWGTAEGGGGGDADLWNAGVGAEYQLTSMPLSIYGGYTHAEFDDFDFSSDALQVGVRWNFGTGSLIERDRSGANLSKPTGAFARIFGS